MTRYRHIFFDLDHTLWDYDLAALHTLTHLHEKYAISCELEHFIEAFKLINAQLWNQYNYGQIDKETLRSTRFGLVFEKLNMALPVPSKLSDDFIEICSAKPYLLAYAKEALEALKHDFCLHIITNGFTETQHIKLKSSDIHHYFKTITTSEDSHARKPQIEMFSYALRAANAQPNESVMIGDNYKADIIGAYEAGLLPVFFSPSPSPNPREVLTISCLSQIPKLLLT